MSDQAHPTPVLIVLAPPRRLVVVDNAATNLDEALIDCGPDALAGVAAEDRDTGLAASRALAAPSDHEFTIRE